MTRRGVGNTLFIISAVLFVARSAIYYIASAIISTTPDKFSGRIDLGFDVLSPPYPHIVWIIPLIVGIAYLVWAEASKE